MSHLGRATVQIKNPNRQVLEESLHLMMQNCELYEVKVVNGQITVFDKARKQTVRVECRAFRGISIVATSEYQRQFQDVQKDLQRHLKRFYNARANIRAVEKMGMQAQVQYGTEEDRDKIRIIAMQG